jgi:hypothetical protein
MTRDSMKTASGQPGRLFRPRSWVRALAQPYLRGYKPLAQAHGALRGYWFLHPDSEIAKPLSNDGLPVFRSAAGFFTGYLINKDQFTTLAPVPPECLVFAFIAPPGEELHARLVSESGSLVRNTFDYIRLLTHRPPRFAFSEQELPALVRHLSMCQWPREKYDHFSRNFFIETLAWLVRSALVRKILVEPLTAPAASSQERTMSATRRAARAISC